MRIAALLHLAQPYGVVTYDEALSVMTRRQFDYLVFTGTVERVHPSTYVVAGFPRCWLQRAHAAVKSVDGSVLSHRSAARLWGLQKVPSERIAITAPLGIGRNRDGVRLHHSGQLQGFITRVNGLPATTVARTLIDVASVTSDKTLVGAIDEARRLKLVTLEELAHCWQHMTLAGFPRLGAMRKYLHTNFSEDDELETALEVERLAWVRDAELPIPNRQRAVIANGHRYVPDMVYRPEKIAIEADGPHHELPSIKLYDQMRDGELHDTGYLVIRSPHTMTREEFLPLVRSALRERSR